MKKIKFGQIIIDQIMGLILLFSILFAFYKSYEIHAYYGIDFNFSNYKLLHFIIFNSLFVGIFSQFIRNNLALAGMIMYFFVVLPINAYYVTADQSTPFFLTVNLSFALFLSIIVFFPNLKVYDLNLNESYISFVLFSILVISMVFGFFLLTKGPPSMDLLFDISSVYEFRSEYSQPVIIEYFRSFLVYALVPIVFCYFQERKKYILAILSLVLNILIYLYTGSRFIFVLTLFIPAFYFLTKMKNPLRISMLSLIGLFLISSILIDTDFYFISHFIFFRPIEIPAWLSFVYHDYFIIDGIYYYSESFSMLNFENKDPAPRVIGDFLFPDDGTTWANVGFFGHAFYNLGYVGVFLNSIILGLIFWITFELCQNVKSITTSIIMLYCYYLANFGLLTMLFNRGFVAAFILLILSSSFSKQKVIK